MNGQSIEQHRSERRKVDTKVDKKERKNSKGLKGQRKGKGERLRVRVDYRETEREEGGAGKRLIRKLISKKGQTGMA